jgi:hypothetical protein
VVRQEPGIGEMCPLRQVNKSLDSACDHISATS